MRVLHALLAVVVVTAGLVGPAATATPSSPAPTAGGGDVTVAATTPPSPAQTDGSRRSPPPSEMTSVLAIQVNATNRSTIRETYVDFGPAVAFGTNESSYRLGTIRALNRVRNADDQGAALRRAVSRVGARSDALGRAQRAALDAYITGDADARTTLVRLARIDREARALDRRRERLAGLADELGVAMNDARVAALGRELATYTGPVRARIHAALTGDAPPTQVYVAAAPRSVTLAATVEGSYVRETYRGDVRRTGPGEVSEAEARNAVARSYPTVWAARENVSVDPGGNAVVEVRYAGGRLTAHVGAGNGRVFRDVHVQSLDRAATNETAVNVRDGLRLVVNRTYAGAPMRIRVTDTDGDPVRANVSVGPEGGESVTVGSTDGNGGVWALTPDGRFTVVAIHDGSSVVFLRMDPLATPRVNDRPSRS
ncbi:MAG: hypothetical protein ABEJ61_02240 [Haloferacaceae archaeon]